MSKHITTCLICFLTFLLEISLLIITATPVEINDCFYVHCSIFYFFLLLLLFFLLGKYLN